MKSIAKKGTLGTIISIVLMLIVIGVTFSICSTIFRKTTASEETFNKIIQQLQDLQTKTTGSRNVIAAQLNTKTAIIGFSRGNKNLEVHGKYAGEQRKLLDIKKPTSCGVDSCICFCDKPGEREELNELFACDRLDCITEKTFGNIDFSPTVYMDLLTNAEDEKSSNGFFIYRGPMRALHVPFEESATPEIIRGQFTLYLERKEDAVAVCVNPDEQTQSCAVPEAKAAP
ncbi:hypothetical protein HY488_01725 [Candidatus Woesearchaeota archaeon]|nr:hypothetical protein [Candidatus Woesearchaeota archaeon]